MLFLLGPPIQNPFSRGAIHFLNCLNGNVWNLWNNWNNTFDQRRRVVSTQSNLFGQGQRYCAGLTKRCTGMLPNSKRGSYGMPSRIRSR
jgi:hypothetical protein